MKNELKYFFGVYRDYVYDPVKKGEPVISRQRSVKVGQLCLSVDDLSCEMLADPGLITFYQASRIDAIRNAKALAKQHGCAMIEYNLEKYRIHKVK